MEIVKTLEGQFEQTGTSLQKAASVLTSNSDTSFDPERRRNLGLLASGAATALTAGCIGGAFGGGSNDQNTDTATGSPTPTEKPGTETNTATETEEPRFPSSGTIQPLLKGGNPWPDSFFNGNVVLRIDKTATELRERYHWNQIDRIADNRFPEKDHPKKNRLLKQFPRRLTESEWLRTNILEPIEEEHDEDIPLEKLFKKEEYLSDNELDYRVVKSNYDGLWTQMEHKVFGGVSSVWDFVRAAGLSGAEHYSAGNKTFTTHQKTLDAEHGLGYALTNLTYEAAKKEAQETWGLETDPSEDTPVWDLDKTETYPNDDERIMLDTEEGEGGSDAWQLLGFDQYMPDNVIVEFRKGVRFEDFLRNPNNQLGMKYVDSACLAAYINEEAHEDGELPEFKGATLEVYPDRIEYDLAA